MPSSRRPSIRYGQNFLTNAHLVDRLLATSSIGSDDLVYEIGPGAGIITERLARRCRKVVAIEKDPALARRLQRRFGNDPHLEIRVGDFLDATLPATRFKVFASIPFNRTAAIVTKLTGAAPPPEDQYLVVQREAAARFMGRPVTTLSALLLAPWFDVRVGHRFRGADFTPPPGVDVVLLRIAKRGPPLVPDAEAQLYRDFVVSAFTAWRPSAADALALACGQECVRRMFGRTDLSLRAKPSEIPVEGWLALFQAFRRFASDPACRRLQGAEARLWLQQAGLPKVHRTRRCTSGPGPPRRPVIPAGSVRPRPASVQALPCSRTRPGTRLDWSRVGAGRGILYLGQRLRALHFTAR